MLVGPMGGQRQRTSQNDVGFKNCLHAKLFGLLLGLILVQYCCITNAFSWLILCKAYFKGVLKHV